MLRHTDFDMKGGFRTFAASASQSSINGMTGHSKDHQTRAFSTLPQVGLEPTLTDAAGCMNVSKLRTSAVLESLKRSFKLR